MPGHSPSKRGVNALMAGIHALFERAEDVNGRDKPGHDENSSTPQMARGPMAVALLFERRDHR